MNPDKYSNEEGDLWRQIKADSKAHRQDKQEWSKELIDEFCKQSGVVMQQVHPWQVRLTSVNITVDIYPQRQSYHMIYPTNYRGKYKEIISFLDITFKTQ